MDIPLISDVLYNAVTDRTKTLTHQLWLWRKRYLVTDTYISQQWKVVEGRGMRLAHVISVR